LLIEISRSSIVHYADNMGVPGSDYLGYYPIDFGVYQGTWLEAAQRILERRSF
jgi:hypothetical protein